MRIRYYYLAAFTLVIFSSFLGCTPFTRESLFVEPNPRADTYTKEIEYQEKMIHSFEDGSLTFDNLFDGARLNDCYLLNDSTYEVVITPENEPINESPWYAFRIVTEEPQEFWIKLSYQNAKHRYDPKLSVNGNDWERITDDRMQISDDDSLAFLHIEMDSDTLWVAAQEVVSSKDVVSWTKSFAEYKNVRYSTLGESILERPIPLLDIYSGRKRNKPIIVVLSRQHPPEVTGYYAMQAFVETLIKSGNLSDDFFKKYRVLVIPMANPDGIDLGHWRHNAGGVDLNRDWGNYHQSEIRQIASHISKIEHRTSNKNDIILGLDFHSTRYDIYYTNHPDSINPSIGTFKDEWLAEIEARIEDYEVNEEASDVRPVATSKNWFFVQLGAVGITYEIGDDTPVDFIREKGRVSAEAMMAILTSDK